MVSRRKDGLQHRAIQEMLGMASRKAVKCLKGNDKLFEPGKRQTLKDNDKLLKLPLKETQRESLCMASWKDGRHFTSRSSLH